ncbi:MAG: FHA domain-containing protein [Thermostichales cyanobacterium HHBFW_bins_127]
MSDPQPPLLIVEDSRGIRTYTLTEPVCTLGRSRENTIQIVGEFVSRRHAYLRRLDSTDPVTFEIVDGETGGNTPSTNGIFVNKHRVMSQVLRSGDLIHFGPQVKATFLIPTTQPAQSASQDSLLFDSPQGICVDTGADTAHQMIPTIDWHLDDYYPEDLLELIELGHFDNPQSAQCLKTAIYEQCQCSGQWGTIQPEWQPVLERLESLRRSRS